MHGQRTRQCGNGMPGNEVHALHHTGNNVPASLQKFEMTKKAIKVHVVIIRTSSTWIKDVKLLFEIKQKGSH